MFLREVSFGNEISSRMLVSSTKAGLCDRAPCHGSQTFCCTGKTTRSRFPRRLPGCALEVTRHVSPAARLCFPAHLTGTSNS